MVWLNRFAVRLGGPPAGLGLHLGHGTEFAAGEERVSNVGPRALDAGFGQRLIKRTWSKLARICRQIRDLALRTGEPLAVPLEPVELSGRLLYPPITAPRVDHRD